MADGGARECGRGCYGTGTSKTKEGKRSGAHSEFVGGLVGLGDGLWTTYRRRRSAVPEVEDDVDGGDTARPRLLGSSRRRRRRRWGSRARQRGEGKAVAAAAASGGDELRSVGERGSQRRGWGRESERGGSRGCVASSRSTGEEPGRQGGRRWPARGGHAPPSFWRGRKTTGRRRWWAGPLLGCTVLGCGWAAR